MSIPMTPVTVKLPPDEVPMLRAQAESQGFEGISDYVRHLVHSDRELLRKKWSALNPIFGTGAGDIKLSMVGRGTTEDAQ